MNYKTMPGSQDKLSALGFGCMRFPLDDQGKIDQPSAIEMLQYAYDHGVNYFDTAWPYHNSESEPLLGEFLASIAREKVFVATKLPCWLVKEAGDPLKYLKLQLEKLKTGYIDYYLLHALNQRSWAAMKKLKVLDSLVQAKKDGLIRHIGFSFHDSYPVFKRIVDGFDWEFCQIMLNYLDTHYQAGMNGYRLAVSKGMGVISMEPLRGGKLVAPIPEEVEKLWQGSEFYQKPLERALAWVWDLPGCSVCLSGMSSLEQLKQNILLEKHLSNKTLTDKERTLYIKARRAYIKRIAIPCTECRYCMPCPHGVGIPFVFGQYNEAMMFGNKERHKQEYEAFISPEMRADKCTHCGECLSKCPRHIAIPDEMDRIRDYFS